MPAYQHLSEILEKNLDFSATQLQTNSPSAYKVFIYYKCFPKQAQRISCADFPLDVGIPRNRRYILRFVIYITKFREEIIEYLVG
jgi:hypothetical protein